jgi:cobalt-zinc-cadmium efflux system outer membrane protein
VTRRLRGSFSAAIAIVATALLAGCVPPDAGLADMQRALTERGVAWEPPAAVGDVSSADAPSAERSALLASALDAEGAARLALLSSPRAGEALATLGIARGQLVAASRLPNPKLGTSVRVGAGDADALDIDVGVSIDVTDLVLRRLRIAPAERELSAAALDAAGVALDLAFEARRALYRDEAARRVLELRKTVAFAAAQGAQAARALTESGNLVELDALQQRALFEEARLAVARAEVEAAAARQGLVAALGLFGGESASLRFAEVLAVPPATELDLTDAERRVVARSLELAALRERVAAAGTRAELARVGGWLPELELGVSAERGETHWGIGPEVGLGLPLFYQNQGEIAAAEGEQQRALAQAGRIGITLRAAVRATATRLSVARDRAVFYRDTLVPLRASIVAESLLQYNAMNLAVFQLLAAKRDEIEARASEIEALRDYWTARAELEQLMRGRLPGGYAGLSDDARGKASGAAPHD